MNLVGLDHRAVSFGAAVLFLAAAEVGCRLGLRRAPTTADAVRQQLGTVEAAVLALLGLLLAFSFSMAETRFEARRLAVVDEANAIGTAWLRADALAEPDRAEEKRLLHDYVDARLAFYDAGEDERAIDAAVAAAERLHGRMWGVAMTAASASPGSVPLALLLQALNVVIDDHTVRVSALRAHVPVAVLVLLVAFATAALGSVGYAFGLAGRRAFGAVLVLSLLVAATLYVVLDLDRPRGGLIRESQWSMRALRDAMDETAP